MVIRRQSGSEWQEGLRMRPVIIYDAGETADIRGNIILFVRVVVVLVTLSW